MRRKCLRLAPFLVAFTGAALAPAQSTIIYQTGFEPPTFSTGPLNGQNNWQAIGPASSAVIETAVVKTGLQAVQVSPSAASLDGASRAAAYNAANEILTFSVDANLSATGTPSFWTVLDSQYITTAAYGNIDFNIDQTGQMHIFAMGTDNPTSAFITRGTWNHYELDVNFFNSTISAFYNGTPILHSAPFVPTGATLKAYAFDSQAGSLSGTDQAYFDNWSVTAAAPTTPTILPQFAFGGGWYSALYFTNTGTESVSFTVNFTSDNGTPLIVPSIGSSSTTVNLASRATAILEAPNVGALSQGYATASLPAGVTGYAVFRQSVPGIADQEAVALLASTSSSASTLVFDDTNYTTAVAIANPGTVPVTVSITAWNNAGAVIGTSSVALAPGAKTEAVLRSLAGLSAIAGDRGCAEFTVNSGSVAVLGLRFNGAAFTSIPAVQQ